MKSPKRHISDVMKHALKGLGLGEASIGKVAVSSPRNPKWGDYSTNAAFILSEETQRNPRVCAQSIVEALPRDVFDKVEVESGFINLTLAPEYLFRFLDEARESDTGYGGNDLGKGKAILIEFVSANPTGPLVVANARAAAIGDSLVRIFRHCGYRASSEFYVDDAGRQVDLLGLSVEARLRQLLGENAELPEDGYSGDYVVDIARSLLSNADRLFTMEPAERHSELRKCALGDMLSSQKRSLEAFGVRFDNWAHESDYRTEEGTGRLLRLLGESGDTYQEEGAIWFRSKKYGDERDRVLMKSSGDLTYLVADSVYHSNKFDRGFDRVLDLFGPDHLAQVPSLRAVLKALRYPGDRLEVLIVQWVTLIREGKKLSMSKRGGIFVTMDELIEEVGKDVARFFFLMRKPSSHLDFDIDLAKKTSDENPVYYVQYAHARICSIVDHAAKKGLSMPAVHEADLSLLTEPEERDLMVRIGTFTDVVVDCMEDLSPHRIPFFLQDLAASFHNFYHKHRVVSDNIQLSQARLCLCESLRATIAAGLGLIGVSAPSKM